MYFIAAFSLPLWALRRLNSIRIASKFIPPAALASWPALEPPSVAPAMLQVIERRGRKDQEGRGREEEGGDRGAVSRRTAGDGRRGSRATVARSRTHLGCSSRRSPPPSTAPSTALPPPTVPPPPSTVAGPPHSSRPPPPPPPPSAPARCSGALWQEEASHTERSEN